MYSVAEKMLNYHTILLVSHTSNVMLKILEATLQQYVTESFQMYKQDLEKVEEQRSNFQHLLDHTEMKEISEKASTSASFTML